MYVVMALGMLRMNTSQIHSNISVYSILDVADKTPSILNDKPKLSKEPQVSMPILQRTILKSNITDNSSEAASRVHRDRILWTKNAVILQ